MEEFELISCAQNNDWVCLWTVLAIANMEMKGIELTNCTENKE